MASAFDTKVNSYWMRIRTSRGHGYNAEIKSVTKNRANLLMGNGQSWVGSRRVWVLVEKVEIVEGPNGKYYVCDLEDLVTDGARFEGLSKADVW